MPQDLPPSGGYAPVQYKRNLPARGFRPAYVLLAMGSIMTFGFYKVGKGIRELNEYGREKMWSRIHLTALLTAEEDRDLVRKHYADLAREKELTGNTTSAYNSDRYVRPTFAVTPELTK
ncbi:GRIM-19 protein [Phlyctema vagabunda]|uniref:NADH dehydrogenase [ubiquinone] 1 alpha subcomplex subunit 13 n=1 Tax=Phlyctema vagabunda TaxID=108571 RepID=A0ABR4PS09_9HELO